MNISKNEMELYRSTFDEIHAPEELKRKVIIMAETKPKRKIYAIRKVLYVAAAIIVLFCASNIITYAATGETWIEKTVMQFCIHGEFQEVEMTKKVDENGIAAYEGDYTDENGLPVKEIIVADESDGYDNPVDALNTSAEIVKENGKLYLSAWDLTKNAKIDITDDLADGKAEGTFELNDKEYTYSVTGDEEINSILISEK